MESPLNGKPLKWGFSYIFLNPNFKPQIRFFTANSPNQRMEDLAWIQRTK